MYSELYRIMRLGWPGGLSTRRRLSELSKSQWFSKSQLEDYQFSKLSNLIQYAYQNVPYYQASFSKQGIHPSDLKSLKDLHYLPSLSREDINNNLDQLVSIKDKDRTQMNSTGGSTGSPMRFYVDDSFWWWNAALEFRGRSWHGVREGEKIAWIWGAPHEMKSSGLKSRMKSTIMRYRYMNTFNMTEARMRLFAEELISWKPAMIRATVSALELFANFIKQEKIDGIRPKLIETTAEVLDFHQRETIEYAFDCTVVDCYSARELGTIAYQCDHGSSHISETQIIEVLNHDNPVHPGNLGEIVVTSLTQFSMPLIRYKLDDFGSIDNANCHCNRNLPIIKEIVGKKQGILVTSDGRFVYGTFFTTLFKKFDQIQRYQVHQYELNKIVVRLVCKKPLSVDDVTKIKEKIQNHFGEMTDIELYQVENIELTAAGKHQFVISDIEPEFR